MFAVNRNKQKCSLLWFKQSFDELLSLDQQLRESMFKYSDVIVIKA